MRPEINWHALDLNGFLYHWIKINKYIVTLMKYNNNSNNNKL